MDRLLKLIAFGFILTNLNARKKMMLEKEDGAIEDGLDIKLPNLQLVVLTKDKSY